MKDSLRIKLERVYRYVPISKVGIFTLKKVDKGVRGMPRLSEAKKDVLSCEKLRGVAQKR